MSHPREPRMPPPDDGALLSAWLAGDLDDRQFAILERRLETDPGFAARLDEMAELLVALRRPDQVEVPRGYRDRLRARMQEERTGRPLLNNGPPKQVVAPGLGEHLPRRRQSRRPPGPRRARLRAHRDRFPRWPAVAAVVLVIALVASLPLLRPPGEVEMAREETVAGATDDSAEGLSGPPAIAGRLQPPIVIEEPDAQVHAPPGDDATTLEAPGAGDAALEDDASGAQREDAQANSGEAADGEDASADRDPETLGTDDLRERFAEVPEATELLGLPEDRAAATAARYRTIIEEAPPFSTGVEPSACLDVVTEQERHSVPVRVEAFAHQGRSALAYVVVKASETAAALDRIEVWVMDPDTCTIEAFVST